MTAVGNNINTRFKDNHPHFSLGTTSGKWLWVSRLIPENHCKSLLTLSHYQKFLDSHLWFLIPWPQNCSDCTQCYVLWSTKCRFENLVLVLGLAGTAQPKCIVREFPLHRANPYLQLCNYLQNVARKKRIVRTSFLWYLIAPNMFPLSFSYTTKSIYT